MQSIPQSWQSNPQITPHLTIFCHQLLHFHVHPCTPAHHLTPASRPRPLPQSSPHPILHCKTHASPSGPSFCLSPYLQAPRQLLYIKESWLPHWASMLRLMAHRPAQSTLAASLVPDACNAPAFFSTCRDLECALLSFHPYKCPSSMSNLRLPSSGEPSLPCQLSTPLLRHTAWAHSVKVYSPESYRGWERDTSGRWWAVAHWIRILRIQQKSLWLRSWKASNAERLQRCQQIT